MQIEIRRLGQGDEQAVVAAGFLFDGPPRPDATKRFLAEPGHHLLVAYDAGDRAVGFVSGTEYVHPDKGVSMFLNELSVDEPARRRGIGRRLVEALATLARERGCDGMWVGTELDNVAARRTYASAHGEESDPFALYEWEFGAP